MADDHSSSPSEFIMFVRWVAGLFLILFCGWGFIGVAAYALRSRLNVSLETVGSLAALLSLGLFLFLERNFWLSRFMGLRYTPDTATWPSAVYLWLLGVPGLLFRSTQAPATTSATQAKGNAPGQDVAPDSFREIVETVVFVVVLVLLLKSFTAEAFVIPTGSMATTLYGYQKDVTCPKCGYQFPVNCSDEAERKEYRIEGGTCPNCRFPIDFPANYYSCSSGDRVLVAKYFYDTGLMKPQRLDVVVFKYPQEPQKQHVAMNYIKRLIGKSGETIGIYYGKLYVLKPEVGPQYPEDLQTVPETERWRERYMHRDEANALLRRADTPFEIIRKPPEKILAMRRIVFDNDHQPSDLKGKVPPRWADESEPTPSWTPDGLFGFRHAATADDAIAWLRYRHILRQGNEPELITDSMGYNSKVAVPLNGRGFGNGGASPAHPALARNWVGDLILECEVTVDEPAGELRFQLSKSNDRFEARWDLASGTCSVWRLTGGQEIKLDQAATAVKKKGTYRLRFANVDNRLTVWVDEQLPFNDGVPYDAPADRGPAAANDLQPAGIGVRGAAVHIRKLSLWRDTYYTVTVQPSSADAPGIQEIYMSGMTEPKKEEKFHELLSQPDKWSEAFRDMPSTTLYVQPGHYLCLGDNSPESSDGRSWGLVPNRLLLGRALLVYWPFPSRAGAIR